MKITAIETHVCHARMRNWVFVRSSPTRTGLYGWGEATLEWHTRAVVGAIEDLAELLVGEDPTRIEHLWQMMYPPALLARQRHRPRHGDQRHRPRAVGHPRQGSRRARVTSSGAGRCATTSALLPSRRREDGGLLRDAGRRRSAFGDLAAGGRGRLHRVQVDGRAADDAARRTASRFGTPRRCVAAMRDAVGDDDRHHGRLPRPAAPADGACCSPRRSSRTACTCSKSRAGRRASTTSPLSSAR